MCKLHQWAKFSWKNHYLLWLSETKHETRQMRSGSSDTRKPKVVERNASISSFIPGPSKGCQLNSKGWWIDTLKRNQLAPLWRCWLFILIWLYLISLLRFLVGFLIFSSGFFGSACAPAIFESPPDAKALSTEVVLASIWEMSIASRRRSCNHWLVRFLLPIAACLNLSTANAIFACFLRFSNNNDLKDASLDFFEIICIII